MNLYRWLFFNWMYLRHPPWDTGISPPELMAFIESHLPGRALDLGCGTGTNAITLTNHGWEVTALDFVWMGIAEARRKARAAGVAVDFRVMDVTRLDGVQGPFDLILDIGCFHSLNRVGQLAYLKNLGSLLAPDGVFLMYGFFRAQNDGGPGMVAEALSLFEPDFELFDRKDGTERGLRPSAWLTYGRRTK